MSTPAPTGEERDGNFWTFQQTQEDSVVPLPYGDPTWAIVDEHEGGIVAYANSERLADLIVKALFDEEERA